MLAARYLDAPVRDGPGAARRFPTLLDGSSSVEHLFSLDKTTIVTTLAALPGALALFDGSELLGFDTEWRSAMLQPKPPTGKRKPGKTALLQLCDDAHGVVIDLFALGAVPSALASFLAKKRLGGINIGAKVGTGDLGKLSHDYPEAGLNHHKGATGPSVFCEGMVIELAPLGADVLRIGKAAVRSLELLFARCCKGRVLNKLLCSEKGVAHVDWQRRPLVQNELQYAINDASASFLSAKRLLHGSPARTPDSQVGSGDHTPPEEELLPGVLPPMPSAAEVSRWASSYNELADRVQEELAAAGLGDGDDDGNLAAAADDAEAVPDGVDEEGEEEAANFETRKSVLQAAALLVQAWDSSGSAEPLRLPTFLTPDDRAALHAFCEKRGLAHVTDVDGDGDESSISRLVVSRRSDWNSAAGSSAASDAAGSSAAHTASGAAPSESERIYTALQFYENWKKLRIKYDPRHWMGNWFLMAASKTSPLFKYFCCATADAMFKVCEGERERVKAHLRMLFTQGEGYRRA